MTARYIILGETGFEICYRVNSVVNGIIKVYGIQKELLTQTSHINFSYAP